MKILICDIERLPGLARAWHPKTRYIHPSQFVRHPRTICFAYGWLDQTKVGFVAEWYKGGHEGMLKKAFSLYEEADAVITFNGVNFDNRHFVDDWTTYDMGLPKPWQDIDLFKVAKNRLGFESKSLDELCKRFGLQAKVDKYDPEVAERAVDGSEKDRRRLARYNRGDIEAPRGLYYKMRHLITNHPHHGLYNESDVDVCNKCGSDDLEKRGYAYTSVTKFQQYKCRICGGWSRGKKALQSAGARGTK